MASSHLAHGSARNLSALCGLLRRREVRAQQDHQKLIEQTSCEGSCAAQGFQLTCDVVESVAMLVQARTMMAEAARLERAWRRSCSQEHSALQRSREAADRAVGPWVFLFTNTGSGHTGGDAVSYKTSYCTPCTVPRNV